MFEHVAPMLQCCHAIIYGPGVPCTESSNVLHWLNMELLYLCDIGELYSCTY